MKRIVFLVFMFFSTLAVAEWTWVVTTDEGDKFYIDLETIQRSVNMVKFWEKLELKKPEKYFNESHKSARTYSEYDCKEKKFRYLTITYYTQNDLKGKVVYVSNTPYDWTFIPPDSSSNEKFRLICKN